MSVYVDRMRAPLKRGNRTLIMCHMIADTPDELRAMARLIDVPCSGLEDEGTYREHWDICLSKRRLAVAAGAQGDHAARTRREAAVSPSRPTGVPHAGAGGMKKLRDLDPKLTNAGVLTFDCPSGASHRVRVKIADHWSASGTFPDAFTLTPSVNEDGCWHGWITNGEVTNA